jgi:Tfp pilus assembly protein FimT
MKGYHKMNFSHRSSTAECGARGFSMLELMIVCCVMMIVAGIGFMALQPVLKDARANSAFETAMMPLRTARQRAIAERKQYIVCFGIAPPTGALTPMGVPTAQSVQIFRWDAGTALSAAVQVTAVTLPNDIQFQALAGCPMVRQRYRTDSETQPLLSILIKPSPGRSRTRSCSCRTARRTTSTET